MDFMKFSQIALFCTALLFDSPLFAQDDWKVYDDADALMTQGQYDMALEAFRFIGHLPDVPYKITICSLLSDRIKNQPVDKFLAYEASKGNDDPLYYYWLGKIYLKRLWIAESKESYEKFLALENAQMAGLAKKEEVTRLLPLLAKVDTGYDVIPFQSPINSNFSDAGAMFFNESTLLFASDRKTEGLYAIYQTTQGQYGWNAPEIISCISGSPPEYLNVLPVKETIFYYDPQVRDLCALHQTASGWSKPQPLETKVLANAQHIYINKYKTRLIFSAKNGVGNLDLYESIKLRTTGEWTEPLPIADELNTGYSEDYPFLTEDRKRLYFCSDRPEGLGKMDIYVSEFDEENVRWGPPVNLGAQINSMDNDIDFKILEGGEAIFSSDRMASRGSLDIFMISRKD